MNVLNAVTVVRNSWKKFLLWVLFWFSALVLTGAVILTAVVFLAVDWVLGVGLVFLDIIPATATLFFYLLASHKAKS